MSSATRSDSRVTTAMAAGEKSEPAGAQPKSDRTVLDRRIATDKRDSRWFAGLVFGAFFLGAACMSLLAFMLRAGWRTAPLAVGVALLADFLLLVAFVGPLVVIALRRIRSRHAEFSQDDFDLIDKAVAEVHDSALGQLISFNFRVMDRFVSLALAQAKAAYIFCAAASSAALLVLLAGATCVITADTVSAKVMVAILSGLGATLSAYIGSTFIKALTITSSHAAYYYGQPLVHCYLLHAEWLAERVGNDRATIPTDLRDRLVRDTLGAGRNAQNQLFELLRPPRNKREDDGRPRPDDTLEPETEAAAVIT
jgi:VIT1/CCC1 family predicted Fe2+/Mn2+ transporter